MMDCKEVIAENKELEIEESYRKLSNDELDAVSGGILWFDDDAPDGHELSCIYTWYTGWNDFYIQNQYTYCWGGKGKKHEFGGTYMDDYYVFGGDVEMHDCKLCGKAVPVHPRPGDYK